MRQEWEASRGSKLFFSPYIVLDNLTPGLISHSVPRSLTWRSLPPGQQQEDVSHNGVLDTLSQAAVSAWWLVPWSCMLKEAVVSWPEK